VKINKDLVEENRLEDREVKLQVYSKGPERWIFRGESKWILSAVKNRSSSFVARETESFSTKTEIRLDKHHFASCSLEAVLSKKKWKRSLQTGCDGAGESLSGKRQSKEESLPDDGIRIWLNLFDAKAGGRLFRSVWRPGKILGSQWGGRGDSAQLFLLEKIAAFVTKSR